MEFNEIYNLAIDKFLSVYKGALIDEDAFNNFRHRLATETTLIEHVTYEKGLEYIQETLPEILDNIEKFSTNDNIGNPKTHYYDVLDVFVSTATLKYMKVLSDLVVHFGSLDGLNIIEIGVGYGGQCKLIYDLFKPLSYSLIDLYEVVALTRKYLGEYNIHPNANNKKKYDLCISNYAFSEIGREWQDLYNKEIIQRSRMGYMTCNFTNLRKGDGSMSKREILSLKQGMVELPEKPLTAEDNYICIWK